MSNGQDADSKRPSTGVEMSDRGFRNWQWVVGSACAIAIIVAIVLSASKPSLTYQSIGENDDDVTVKCTTSGSIADYPLLDDPTGLRLHYKITSGEEAFEKWKQDQTGAGSNADIFATSRGINADCARADTAQLRTTLWVLVGSVALGFWFVRISSGRRRSRARNAQQPAPTGPTGPEQPDATADKT